MTRGLLAPYRVLDCTDERGAFAGLLLAQLGADVVLVEPGNGGRTRSLAPFVDDVPGVERSLVHKVLNRGKRSVVAERSALLDLVVDADVLLLSGGPAELAADGVPPTDALLARNPALVVAQVSGFGATGPKADWADGDLVCAAAGLQLSLTGDADRPPLRCAVPQVFASACGDAVVGVLVALAERQRSGRGQVVDCSAQESWIWASFYLSYATPWRSPLSSRNGAAPRTGRSTIRFDFPAADGAVTITLAFGAAVGPYTNRLVAWMAEVGECDAELADTDWSTFDLGTDPGRQVRLNDAVAAFTGRRTKAVLLAASRERRLLLAPALRLDEVLAAEQFAERHSWAEIPLDEGRTVRVPGAFAQAVPEPLAALDPAPALGSSSLPPWPRRTGAPGRGHAAGRAGAAPLEGVRVLDLTTSFAGPLTGRMLAAFGARVVKVESERRPDFARTTGPFLDQTIDGSASYAHTNANKWSITLDLSNPASRPVLEDLARWADVIVDAYAPGALARMGLDEMTLRRLNPMVVLLQSTMLGQTGPFASMPGYGNMAGALCGFFTTTAWPDRSPVGPCGAYTDMVSPRFAAAAILAALDHRRRTGVGSRIDLGQGEACLQLLGLGLADTQANGRSWEHVGNRDAFRAPHGVYPTLGDDAWVAVACADDAQWRACAGVVGRDDLAALSLDERLARHDELDDVVGTWTSTRTADAAAAALQAAGVAAHAVQNSPECAVDPQLLHRGWVVDVPHAAIGTVAVGVPPMRLSRTPARLEAAGPCLGEHTTDVLTELLGYGDDRIAELAVADVLR